MHSERVCWCDGCLWLTSKYTSKMKANQPWRACLASKMTKYRFVKIKHTQFVMAVFMYCWWIELLMRPHSEHVDICTMLGYIFYLIAELHVTKNTKSTYNQMSKSEQYSCAVVVSAIARPPWATLAIWRHKGSCHWLYKWKTSLFSSARGMLVASLHLK